MAERRAPRTIIKGSTPPVDIIWLQVMKLSEDMAAAHDGLPAAHVHLDDGGTVADPETAGDARSKAQIFLHMGA